MEETLKPLNDKALELVAERFRVLGDPLRLRLLQLLADGERSVSELVAGTGAAQANVSKHLQHLLHAGVVARRKEGLRVYYTLADPRVFQICDVVCGSLAEHLERELESFRMPASLRMEGPADLGGTSNAGLHPPAGSGVSGGGRKKAKAKREKRASAAGGKKTAKVGPKRPARTSGRKGAAGAGA